MKKIFKSKLTKLFLLLGCWLITVQGAVAEKIGEKTAEEVEDKVVVLVGTYAKPLGATLIFVAICITAVRIILTANKPEDRAKAISSLPYILGGGLLLGGAMLVAGLVVGSWTKVQ